MTSSETGVREQLVRWVESDEPPFRLDVERIRSQARGSRRRARASFAVAAAAAAAVAVVTVINPIPRAEPELNRQVTQAETPDPVQYAHQLELLARDAGWEATSGRSYVEALDGRGNPIRGRYRMKATQWHGRFQYSSGSVFDVITGHASDADRPASQTVLMYEQEQCAWRLNNREAEICEVEQTADGVILTYSERAAQQLDGFWLFVDPDRARAAPRWHIRRVSARFSNGFVAVVTEARRSSQLDPSSFRLDKPTLTALARSSALPFPPPPKNDQNCEWVPGTDNPADWC